MPTYYLTCNWNMFITSVKGIKPFANPDNYCFLHSGDEIYIRSSDLDLLDLIGKSYPIKECKNPDKFYLDKSDWEYEGNAIFFRSLLK